MSKIVIFAGTTEGRELSKTLSASNVPHDVSVATDYGAQTMEENEFTHIWHGRLDSYGMRELYRFTQCELVVDATHPYAVGVTDEIKKSLDGLNLQYIRVVRPARTSDGAETYGSAQECAKALAQTEGKILLTTGSKELDAFCKDENLRSRLIVRVIPSLESLKLCYDAGLEGKQIIAAQGPFSKETNVAAIRQYGVKHVVTKESGAVGGEDAKRAAALETGARYWTIARPAPQEQGETFAETLLAIEERLEIRLKRGVVEVTLAGIGCGSQDHTTQEVRKQIERSDYLFGAPRMLENVETNAKKYPFYLANDILPILETIQKERPDDVAVTVLFSGDTGFYSGCGKLLNALQGRERIKTRVLPGVSSICAFAAKIGVSWDDAKILSLHGIPSDVWAPKLVDSITYNAKTFFIASGPEDLQKIGALVQTIPYYEDTIAIRVGYALSYPNERIATLTPEKCRNVTTPGLYVGAILQSDPRPRRLAFSIKDGEFTRGSVPMSKEETRLISIAKLGLMENDVVYDIGAGTGTIAIQCALTSPTLRVYAIEKDREGVELIQENAKRMRAVNVRAVEGTAPEALGGLPPADAAFIGGSGGNLEAILGKLYDINPAMRVVVNAAALETIAQTTELVQRFPIEDLDVVQVNAARAQRLGGYRLMKANNPVFVFSFRFI